MLGFVVMEGHICGFGICVMHVCAKGGCIKLPPNEIRNENMQLFVGIIDSYKSTIVQCIYIFFVLQN